MVASATYDVTVKLWGTNLEQRPDIWRNSGCWDNPVRQIATSLDQQQVYTISPDGDMANWDINGGLLHDLQGHDRGAQMFKTSLDHQLITLGSNSVDLYNLQTGMYVASSGTPRLASDRFTCNDVSEDDSLTALSTRKGLLEIWDGGLSRILHTIMASTESISITAFSHCNRCVATVSASNNIDIWDILSGGRIGSMQLWGSLNASY